MAALPDAALPFDATITPVAVSDFAHLTASMRAKWIQCIVCRAIPVETIYRARIPARQVANTRSQAVATLCCSEICARTWIATYEPTFHPIADAANSAPPTQTPRDGWIHCVRETGDYPAETPRSGKWLIWLSEQAVDSCWARIKHAVEAGHLGSGAKVSTAGSRTDQRPRYVVCVYTYDYADRADVMRIREALRRLGIQRAIIYKANEDTAALRYGSDYTPKYRK